MNYSSSSIMPVLSPSLLSGNANVYGATDQAKLKAACKAVEGMFAGQLLSEIGKGMDGSDDADGTDGAGSTGGLYQSFIQQALAQQVTAGGGFGLAKMLEHSLSSKIHDTATGTTGNTIHAATTTLPPVKNNNSVVLREFDTLLETMIGLQRKEQALILARKTDELAATTQSIEWMGLRMQSMEVEVRRELDKATAAGTPQKHIGDKLAAIKRLALQNRTLLEHSLFFPQQLFQQVMERDTPLHLYNPNGHAFQNNLGGGLLETRI